MLNLANIFYSQFFIKLFEKLIFYLQNSNSNQLTQINIITLLVAALRTLN